MPRTRRRSFLRAALAMGGLPLGLRPQAPATLASRWANPPADCRPRTRWWWPGSAVSKEGIASQLQEMKERGLGGAEIVVLYGYYEKGGIPFLTPGWCEMVRYALQEAQSLGLTMALVFSPGWDFGSPMVPPEERSKCLSPCFLEVPGPMSYEGPLPPFKDFGTPTTGLFASLAPVEGSPPDHNLVVAVVGARFTSPKTIDPLTLVDLTAEFRGEAGRWRVEEGDWRLMAFRLRYTGQQNSSQNNEPKSWVVDHLSETAMRRYASGMAERFRQEFGPWLGSTVDSIFADSFEAVPLANSILWSNDTLEQFRRRKGYDFTPCLPAIWFDCGEHTARWRYDLNETLHQIGLECCFQPFLEACRSIGVLGRMQPHYRFTEEIVQGAGMAHRAETEVTTARFETVADPRKATVSGARLYRDDPVVSAEAYTFIHPERFRTTPEEIKRATDAFLRDGVNLFYNHGFLYTEEPEVAPQRDFWAGERISPWMPWWPYYRGLAEYIARCCSVLRQGRFVADVLLYSPQPQVWSQRALFGIQQRVMDYGDLPKTLLANGYDYDVVNSHLLENKAETAAGRLRIGGQSYRALILPAVDTVPLTTMRALERFAEVGVAVYAMDRLPSFSSGMAEKNGDAEVQALAARLQFIPDYGLTSKLFSPREAPYEKTPPLTPSKRRFLERLSTVVRPQVRLAGGQQSNGLTFHQRTIEGRAVYFLTNLQPLAHQGPVWFRDGAGWPELWDPLTAERAPAEGWRPAGGGMEVDLSLEPWGSVILVFQGGRPPKPRPRPMASGPVIPVSGPWQLEIEGVRFPARQFRLESLTPWNQHAELWHCSGRGIYRTTFALPRASEAILDLGGVGCAAEVFLNGRSAGVRWMQPYRFPLAAQSLRRGENRLEVRIANTLLAHVQGLQEPPEIPPNLIPRYGRTLPMDAVLRAAWERDRAFQPLPLSGLAGPVTVQYRKP